MLCRILVATSYLLLLFTGSPFCHSSCVSKACMRYWCLIIRDFHDLAAYVCAGAMVDAARGTGLAVTNVVDIGVHYATTLRQWRSAWEANKAAILACKQTERFWRKFRCNCWIL